MIMGHPMDTQAEDRRAAPQVFSIRSDAFIGINPNRTRVHYRTNTRGGSSGSPVMTLAGDVVALHHFGVRRRFNQGVPISAILKRPLVASALKA